jgi:hypothetical protein
LQGTIVGILPDVAAKSQFADIRAEIRIFVSRL